MNLQALLDIYNGASFQEAGVVEWGYIEPPWYLQIPRGHSYTKMDAIKMGSSPFGDKLSEANFLKANYRALAQPNVLGNPDKALFATLLRFHCVSSGIFTLDKNARHVMEDEYNIADPLGDNWDDAQNNIPLNENHPAIARFIKRFADTLIQMMVFVFTARGHHWQSEYDGLYDRLIQTCGVEKPERWAFPTNKELFRSIMHCFGIYQPYQFCEFARATGRMCSPMNLRFQPHPPIAGAQIVYTSVATLGVMAQETWFGQYEKKFAEELHIVSEEHRRVNEHPMDYHVASKVLAGTQRRAISSEFMKAFSRISQTLLGYIDHLGRKHSLYGQKVITSKAGGLSPLGETFSSACDKFSKLSLEGLNMRTLLELI